MRAREFVTEQAADGPIRAYHGTFQPTIERFQPLSHFGTRAAAEERLRFKGKREGINRPGRIYQVALDIKRPFRVKDFAGIHSPTHFAFDLRQAGLIDQEEMLAITRLAGDAQQGQALINKLRELGFDGMVYRNKYEDPGSESYVITDPSQVIRVKPADSGMAEALVHRGQVRNQDPNDVWHVRDDRTRKLRHHRGSVVLAQARPKMYQDDVRASYQYTPDARGRVRRSLPSFHWAYIQGNMVNRLPQALQQGRQLWFKRGQGFVYADTQEPFAQADYVVFDNDGRVMAYNSTQPAPAAGPEVTVSPAEIADGVKG